MRPVNYTDEQISKSVYEADKHNAHISDVEKFHEKQMTRYRAVAIEAQTAMLAKIVKHSTWLDGYLYVNHDFIEKLWQQLEDRHNETESEKIYRETTDSMIKEANKPENITERYLKDNQKLNNIADKVVGCEQLENGE